MKRAAIAAIVAALAIASPAAAFNPIKIYGCAYGIVHSCGTSYKDAISVLQIDGATLRISATGNSFTSSNTLYVYALRAAAERAISMGFETFVVAQDADASRQYVASEYADGRGVATFTRPGRGMLVKLTHEPKTDQSPVGTYDAKEVLANLAPAPPVQ